MTPAFLDAVLAGRREDAARELACSLPDGFPDDHDRGFLGLRQRQMHERVEFETWCPFAIVQEGAMIGHAGFHGPPGVNAIRDPGAVELGYTVFEPHRGNGYATEAVRALLELAETRGIHRFVLSVSPENAPSLAIVHKLGFVHTGEQMDEEDGLELVFELERSG